MTAMQSNRGVGPITRPDTNGLVARTGLGASRDDLPMMLDRMTIAIESLRTQWRSVAHLGTHERMTISQLRVYGAMPMSELAARISLSRAAVTSLIDRLEAEGWVKREPDDHDRRRTVLRLLDQSQERYDSISEDYNRELAEWATSMSEDEWRAVASFVRRASEIAERRTDGLRAGAAERALL